MKQEEYQDFAEMGEEANCNSTRNNYLELLLMNPKQVFWCRNFPNLLCFPRNHTTNGTKLIYFRPHTLLLLYFTVHQAHLDSAFAHFSILKEVISMNLIPISFYQDSLYIELVQIVLAILYSGSLFHEICNPS